LYTRTPKYGEGLVAGSRGELGSRGAQLAGELVGGDDNKRRIECVEMVGEEGGENCA